MTTLSWTYVYVIYRVDVSDPPPSPATDANERVTIKEVLPTREEAEAEVTRLNKITEGKGCSYYYQNARYYARGRP
jgi:hypothetical protein